MYVKFSKCEFWLDKVIFLRHVISKDKIQMDPKNIETVQKWLRLIFVIKVWSFLGLAKYYRHFIKDFSKITPH